MPAFAALALILSLTLAGCVSSGAPGSRGYENTPSGGIVPGQRGL